MGHNDSRSWTAAEVTQAEAGQANTPEPLAEARADLSAHARPSPPSILWRLDPVIARVAQWADEDPETMRKLLEDPELRAHLQRALDELSPGESDSSAHCEDRA
jgi:hypothetical protein